MNMTQAFTKIKKLLGVLHDEPAQAEAAGPATPARAASPARMVRP